MIEAADRQRCERDSHPRWVTVWDLAHRLWHWALAVAVIVAWATPNTYDRVHRIAGYVVIGLVVFRLGYGVLGPRHSRFRGLLRKLRACPAYIANLRRGQVGRYVGLNPAGAAMLVAMMATLTVSAVTGVMQVTVTFFGVWSVEDSHALFSHAVLVLAVLHVAGSVVVSCLQRDNLPKAMITGRKRRRN